jgi:DNA-binding HxlR family transcriptional regulator
MNEPKGHCPLTIAVKVISGKWKLFILSILSNGEVKRYGEIRNTCENITEKMLTSQLRELEKDGIVFRKVYAQVPPKVEYSLTDLGQKLCLIFDPLYEWSVDYIKEIRPDQLHLIKDNDYCA